MPTDQALHRQNPYAFAGTPISEPIFFVGRQKETKRFFRLLQDARSGAFHVKGDRRLGKSSLLNMLANRRFHETSDSSGRARLGQADQLVFCERIGLEGAFYLKATLSDELLRSMGDASLERTERSVTEKIRLLRDEEGRSSGSRLMDAVKLLNHEGLRPVFFVDEAEALTKLPGPGEAFRLMISLVQSREAFIVLATATDLKSLPWPPEASQDLREPLARFVALAAANTVDLGCFSEEESISLMDPAPFLDESVGARVAKWLRDLSSWMGSSEKALAAPGEEMSGFLAVVCAAQADDPERTVPWQLDGLQFQQALRVELTAGEAANLLRELEALAIEAEIPGRRLRVGLALADLARSRKEGPLELLLRYISAQLSPLIPYRNEIRIVAGSQPYLLASVCRELWHILHEADCSEPGNPGGLTLVPKASVWPTVQRGLYDSLRDWFEVLWSQLLDAGQREEIIAVSCSPSNAAPADDWHLGERLRLLLHKGYLSRRDGRLTVASELFRYFVSEQSRRHPEKTGKAAKAPAKPHGTRRGIVVCVDLARYSEIVRILHETGLSAQAVRSLNVQIAGFIRDAAERAHVDHTSAFVKSTGDGAILAFDTAEEADRFAEWIQRLSNEHNLSVDQRLGQRCFRVGAVKGDVVRTKTEIHGYAVTAATRLQTACGTGEILIDAGAWAMLPPERQSLYGPEESVQGKEHDLPYRARRRRVASPASWEPSSHRDADSSRSHSS